MKIQYNPIVVAIIVGAILVSGSLGYVGYNLSQNNVISEEIVANAVGNYVKKQQVETKKAQEEANKPRNVDVTGAEDDDPILGDKKAPVTIIEFSDYQCPFCERHFTTTYPKIKEKYIDTGKVKLIFRDFPLNFHENAQKAAEAAECVRNQGGDEKYFEFHDILFENQAKLNVNDLKKYAATFNLNRTKFNDCLDSGQFKDEVENDVADGKRLGVNGTPSFFINGWMITGAQPFETFEEIIDKELE